MDSIGIYPTLLGMVGWIAPFYLMFIKFSVKLLTAIKLIIAQGKLNLDYGISNGLDLLLQ